MPTTEQVVSPSATGVSTKDIKLNLSEADLTRLNDLVMYQHKDMVAVFGIVHVQKEMNFLATELISSMLKTRADSLKKQIEERRNKIQSEKFRALIAKGVPTQEAWAQVSK